MTLAAALRNPDAYSLIVEPDPIKREVSITRIHPSQPISGPVPVGAGGLLAVHRRQREIGRIAPGRSLDPTDRVGRTMSYKRRLGS